MSKSCVMYPTVETPRGKERSKMFMELGDILQDRNATVDAYYASISKWFEDYGHDLKKNDQGQWSGRDVLALTPVGDMFPASTYGDYMVRTYAGEQNHFETYDSAFAAVREGNKDPISERTPLVPEVTEEGYKLSYTEDREAKADAERQAVLRGRIMALLEHYGIPVEHFEAIEEGLRQAGETVFLETAQATNKLAALIRVANGSSNEVLTEELAHIALEFAPPALRERLSNAISNTQVKEMLGEEFETYSELYEGSQDLLRREAMAKLLTQHILGQYEGKHSSFLSRIWQAIKDLFHGITDGAFLNEVERTDRLFRDYASKIVAKKALLSNEHLSEIVKGKSLYAAIANDTGVRSQISAIDKVGQLMKSRINAFYSQTINKGEMMKTVLDEDRVEDISKARDFLGAASGRVNYALGTAIAVDAIDSLIEGLTIMNDYASMVVNQMQDVETLLNNNNADKDLVAYNVSASLLRNIYMVIANLEENKTLAGEIISMLNMRGSEGGVQMSDKERERLIKMATEIKSKLADHELEAKKAVDKDNLKEKMADLVIDQIIKYFVNAKDGNGNPLFKDADDAREALKNEILRDFGKYSSKSNIFSAMLTPVGTNGDLIHTLMNRFIKVTEASANVAIIERTEYAEKKLSEIKEKYGLENESQWALMRDENGRITGEIVTPFKWFEFEEEKQKIAEKVEDHLGKMVKDFRDKNGLNPTAQIVRGWKSALELKYIEEWEIDHGSSFTEEYVIGTNPDGSEKVETFPGPHFKNEAYDKLSEEQKAFVNAMYSLKRKLDLSAGLKPEPWKAPLIAKRGSSKELNPFKRIAATNWKQYLLGGVIGIEEFEGVHTRDPLGTLLFVHKPKGYTQFGLELSKNPDVDYHTDPISMMKAYAATSAYYTRMSAIKHIVELTRILDVENRGYNKRGNGVGRGKMSDYDAFINRTIYEKNVINDERPDWDKRLDAVIDPFNDLVYVTGLGLNVVSGIKNLINGFLRATALGDSRTGYNATSLVKAALLAHREIPNRWKFNKRGLIDDPLTSLLFLMDSSHDGREAFMQGNVSQIRSLMSLFSTETLMAPLTMGDEWMKTSFAIAYLLNIEAGELNPVAKEEFKGKSLYDYMKSLEIPEGTKITKFVEEELIKFSGAKDRQEMYDWLGGHSQRLLLGTQRVLGAYNDNDRAALNSYAIGRALLTFRNWMPVIISDMFRGTRYNVQNGEFEEGAYVTLWKMMHVKGKDGKNSISAMHALGTAAVAMFVPLMIFKNLRGAVQKKFNLTDMQANNLHRLGRSALIVHAMRAIADTLYLAMLTMGFSDDDDDEPWYEKLAELAMHFIMSLTPILGPQAVKRGWIHTDLYDRMRRNYARFNEAADNSTSSEMETARRYLNKEMKEISLGFIADLYGLASAGSNELHPGDPIAFAMAMVQNNMLGDGAGVKKMDPVQSLESMATSGVAGYKTITNLLGGIGDTYNRIASNSQEGKKKANPTEWENENRYIEESDDSFIVKAWRRYKNDMENGSPADKTFWNAFVVGLIGRNMFNIPFVGDQFREKQMKDIKKYQPSYLTPLPDSFFMKYENLAGEGLSDYEVFERGDSDDDGLNVAY
nr:MAG TPA: hypothetical protein [Crassvirales sp.]